jgi:hypothetical protein
MTAVAPTGGGSVLALAGDVLIIVFLTVTKPTL